VSFGHDLPAVGSGPGGQRAASGAGSAAAKLGRVAIVESPDHDGWRECHRLRQGILALQEPPGSMVVGGATDLDLRPGTGI
jgi:hypothetical protein